MQRKFSIAVAEANFIEDEHGVALQDINIEILKSMRTRLANHHLLLFWS